MPSVFTELLESTTSDLPLLGLCHTARDTKSNHEVFFKRNTIETELCDVYQEQLIYLFYGRPAFKVPAAYYPMCFVFRLENEDIDRIKRKMAFDTGAFHNGYMADYFEGSNAQLGDFEIENQPLEYLSRFVRYFFENNTQYYDGGVNPALNGGHQDVINRYVLMLKEADTDNLDGRRRSIEIQFGQNIDLNQKTPEMLIVSSAHIENEQEKSKLEEQLNCKVILYDQSKSGDFYHDIHGLVRQYFDEKSRL
jgi:hypothetical protein